MVGASDKRKQSRVVHPTSSGARQLSDQPQTCSSRAKKKKTLWDDGATMFHQSLMCIQTQNQPRLKRSNGHRSGMTLLHSLDAHVDHTFVEVAPVMARLASLGSLDRDQFFDMMILFMASALVSAVVVHVSAHHQHRLQQLRREKNSTPSP